MRFVQRRGIKQAKASGNQPAIYHCSYSVLSDKYVIGDDGHEEFRRLMRLYEDFTGCRVLAYTLLRDRFHLLLEVPPRPQDGFTDEALLRRLSGLYPKEKVDEVERALKACRTRGEREAREIHQRFTRRMYDLSEFMKGVMQRFTRWFNRVHGRRGVLCSERFKSVIVKSATESSARAVYFDSLPVRAGLVEDPAEYRFCSYGEAVGGGSSESVKKAREGLVRAVLWDEGVGFEADRWSEVSARYRRWIESALE